MAEIALWGIPSIIIPIPEDVSRDQKSNAYEYARTGAGIVIEQANLTSSILLSEIDQMLENPKRYKNMQELAKANAKEDAGRLIAQELINITVAHQK